MTTTALASEDTRPSMGENHPAALAFHAINNGAQIILLVRNRIDFDIEATYTRAAIGTDLVRASELLTDATEQLARMQELLERQERTIEEQRVEYIRQKRSTDDAYLIISTAKEELGKVTRQRDQLSRDLIGEIKERTEAEREITTLRRKNDTLVARLEAHGRLTHELVDVAARIHNGTHELYRDTVGFIRPLGASPFTETPLLTAGGGV